MRRPGITRDQGLMRPGPVPRTARTENTVLRVMTRHLARHLTRLRAAIAVAVLLVGGGALPAFADNVIGTAVIVGGPLTMVALTGPTFLVTVDGTEQRASSTIGIITTDRRGSGEGWNLQITSTQFTTGGADGRVLPETAMMMTGVTASCITIGCSDPSNIVNYPLAVPAGASAPTPERFFTAGAGSGMGEFQVSPTFELLVPGNAYSGAYTSIITITIASGS